MSKSWKELEDEWEKFDIGDEFKLDDEIRESDYKSKQWVDFKRFRCNQCGARMYSVSGSNSTHRLYQCPKCKSVRWIELEEKEVGTIR